MNRNDDPSPGTVPVVARRSSSGRPLSRKMLRVARMEFRLTAANKAFIVITIIGPFLIVLMSVLPTLLMVGEGPVGTSRIAMIGDDALRDAAMPAFAPTPVEVVHAGDDEVTVRDALQAGRIDAYLVLPGDPGADDPVRFVTLGAAPFHLVGTVEGTISGLIVARRLTEAGLDPQRVQALTRPPRMDVRRIEATGEEAAQDFMGVMLTALAFTMMLYMTILLYGQSIGTSVLREKSGKTVEIMLSSVSPGELLVGKILGKASASLLQYAIWIGMAVLFLQVLSPLLDLEIAIAGGATNYAYLIGFFLLAFFLYSTFYAAIGASAEDEQHLGQLAWPVILFLVLPMIMIGAISANPDGAVPRVLSLFPLTSPIVMFQRLLIGSPPAWEVILSVALLVASIVAMALLAARIFRVGILMTGKRFSFREIIRWASYRG